MRIWAKIIKIDTKVDTDYVYETDMTLTERNLEEMLREICYAMDIPTPLLLKSYFLHFKHFNNLKFYPRDFVESVDFRYFEIENIIEKKKENKFYY